MNQIPPHQSGKTVVSFGDKGLTKPTIGMGSGRPPVPTGQPPVARKPLADLDPGVRSALKAVAQATAAARAAGVPVKGEGQPEMPTVAIPAEPETPAEPEAPKDNQAGLDELRKLLKTGPDNPLDTEERRKAIESRCSDMNIEDMFMKHEVQQEVPIRVGKIVAVFRSPTGIEDKYVEDRLAREAKDMTVQQYQRTLSIYYLVLLLAKLNGVPFTQHLTKDGDVDEAKFNEKLRALRKYPVAILGDLSLNGQWFQERVLALMKDENIKNG